MLWWYADMDVEWEGKGRPGITKGYVLIRVPTLDLVPVKSDVQDLQNLHWDCSWGGDGGEAGGGGGGRGGARKT
jgi:hypothetical protein